MDPLVAAPVLAAVDDRGAQVGVWALGSAPCAVHLGECVLGQLLGRGAIVGEEEGEAVRARPSLAKEVLERCRRGWCCEVRFILRGDTGCFVLVAGCLWPH